MRYEVAYFETMRVIKVVEAESVEDAEVRAALNNEGLVVGSWSAGPPDSDSIEGRQLDRCYPGVGVHVDPHRRCPLR